MKDTKYRAIIRLSLNDDKNSSVRNSAVKNHLQKAGFVNCKTTGSWEVASSNIVKIQKALSALLEELAQLTDNPFEKIEIDHLWIYLDKA